MNELLGVTLVIIFLDFILNYKLQMFVKMKNQGF